MKEGRRYTKKEDGITVLDIDLGSGKNELSAGFSARGKRCRIIGEIPNCFGEYEDIGLSPDEIRMTIEGLNKTIEQQKQFIDSLNCRIDRMLEHARIRQEVNHGKG